MRSSAKESKTRSFFKESDIKIYGTINLWCDECGIKIEGDPYQTSFCGICVCFEPVDFCSKKCWDASDMYNTDNWPPPPEPPENW